MPASVVDASEASTTEAGISVVGTVLCRRQLFFLHRGARRTARCTPQLMVCGCRYPVRRADGEGGQTVAFPARHSEVGYPNFLPDHATGVVVRFVGLRQHPRTPIGVVIQC